MTSGEDVLKVLHNPLDRKEASCQHDRFQNNPPETVYFKLGICRGELFILIDRVWQFTA